MIKECEIINYWKENKELDFETIWNGINIITTRTYTFIIYKYFENFKITVNNYIYGLESENEDLSKLRDVIESKPMLI